MLQNEVEKLCLEEEIAVSKAREAVSPQADNELSYSETTSVQQPISIQPPKSKSDLLEVARISRELPCREKNLDGGLRVRLTSNGEASQKITEQVEPNLRARLSRLSKIAVTKRGLPPRYRKGSFAATQSGFPQAILQ